MFNTISLTCTTFKFHINPLKHASTVIKSMAFAMRLFTNSPRSFGRRGTKNLAIYVCSKKKNHRSSDERGRERNVASLALWPPIHRSGSWSLRNLRISRDRCGGAPSCRRIKSFPVGLWDRPMFNHSRAWNARYWVPINEKRSRTLRLTKLYL